MAPRGGRDDYDDDYNDYDEEDDEGDGIEVQESFTPKINRFVHDMCDWMLLVTGVILLVYLVLYAFYEIALGMGHIRWVYNTFLLLCTIDVFMYLITRFSVVGGETNRCLLWLTFILFASTFAANFIAPIPILASYQINIDHPSYGGDRPKEPEDGEIRNPIADPAHSTAMDCNADPSPSRFKCGVVRSIRTSVWCMYILLIPKPLLFYGILKILFKKGPGRRDRY